MAGAINTKPQRGAGADAALNLPRKRCTPLGERPDLNIAAPGCRMQVPRKKNVRFPRKFAFHRDRAFVSLGTVSSHAANAFSKLRLWPGDGFGRVPRGSDPRSGAVTRCAAGRRGTAWKESSSSDGTGQRSPESDPYQRGVTYSPASNIAQMAGMRIAIFSFKAGGVFK